MSKINFVAKETANQENAFSVCFSSTQRTSDIGNWRIGIEGIKPGKQFNSLPNDRILD